jgi:hypothetical protein
MAVDSSLAIDVFPTGEARSVTGWKRFRVGFFDFGAFRSLALLLLRRVFFALDVIGIDDTAETGLLFVFSQLRPPKE